MAFADFFRTVKNKAVEVYSNFFYDGRDVAPAPRNERPSAGQETPAPQPNQNQQWQNYQQPAQQQYYGGFQQPNQQPYQQPYQQPTPPQPVQPQQPYQQPQAAAQPEQPQLRFRRSAQHASNVVQVDFGGQQPRPEQPEQPQAAAAQLSARVINARGMSDCRTAITLLRNGDAVVIVMENITNPGDMRRLVDTLSGACYSLTATITKVSRYGVYLLAPQTLAVFADQATNQMNSSPARAPQAQPYQVQQYTPQQPLYTNPLQPVQQPYMQQPVMDPQGFTQRAAAPEAAAQTFYQRPVSQDSAIPAFSSRPAGVGYAPDEHAAAQ